MEVETFRFVLKGSVQLTVPPDRQEQIKVRSRAVALFRVFDHHHRCIYMWSWTGMLFLSSQEQRLYEFCFIWVQKYVGQERGTICAHWNADYLLENLSPKDHENVGD